MTSIIWGASGQDGYYLSRLLENMGHHVIGVSRSGNFDHSNILDFNAVSELIKVNKPDFVFHLAADSTTNHDALWHNFDTISRGTLHILEAVKLYSAQTKVFISGSGLQFENTGKPIKETDPFDVRDAYSLCRIQSVYAARYYRKLGIKTYVGYFFNHDSPRRTERHVAKKISSFVKSLHLGSNEILEIGDLSTFKEWTFAGDIVKGIWTLVSQNVVYEANISSGIGHSIQDWIDACFAVIGRSSDGYVRQIEGFKSDYNQLISDPTVIRQLGFFPETSFSELAKMMVNG